MRLTSPEVMAAKCSAESAGMSSDSASGTPSADITAACATSATRVVKSVTSQPRSWRYALINDPLLLRCQGSGLRLRPGELHAGTRSAACAPSQVIAAAPSRPPASEPVSAPREFLPDGRG